MCAQVFTVSFLRGYLRLTYLFGALEDSTCQVSLSEALVKYSQIWVWRQVPLGGPPLHLPAPWGAPPPCQPGLPLPENRAKSQGWEGKEGGKEGRAEA